MSVGRVARPFNVRSERVALQVIAGRCVPYVKQPSAKALGESLLKEHLLVELFGERVAGQVVAGRVVPYVERPRAKALGESLLREYLLIELFGERAAGQVAWVSR
jgi:hypothetical protein